MEINFYKLTQSLGKFRAIKTNGIGNKGIFAEIYNDEIEHTFSANIYSDGKPDDIVINRWIFSCHIEGKYGNYWTDFKIEAVDRKGKTIFLFNTPYQQSYSMLSESDVLCTYFNLMIVYSHFDNIEVANRFNQLLRFVEYDKDWYRYEDSCEIDDNIAINQIKYFKEYYDQNKDNNIDRIFMDQIKQAVNKAVEIYKKNFDSLKIE